MTTYSYEEFFRSDLIDMLHERDYHIAELKEQIEELKKQAKETSDWHAKEDLKREQEDYWQNSKFDYDELPGIGHKY
jgi:hypothetical protein